MSRENLYRRLSNEVRAGQRATDAIDDLVARLMGINRTDGRCMDLLDQHGRMSAGELAAVERLTSGAITAVIDRLERAGYVRRVADPDDRRRVLVELTEHAQQRIAELMGKPMWIAVRRMLSRYSVEQLELLVDFHRLSREFQEDHAEWLREQLGEFRAEAKDARRRRAR